jgi:hypothetical protein
MRPSCGPAADVGTSHLPVVMKLEEESVENSEYSGSGNVPKIAGLRHCVLRHSLQFVSKSLMLQIQVFTSCDWQSAFNAETRHGCFNG